MQEIVSLPGEEWRICPGFPDYQVSNMGRMQSKRHIGRPGPKSKPQEWRLLKCNHPGNHGYIPINLCRDGKTCRYLVHHLVLEAFVGPRPAGWWAACHENNDRTDNRLSNLRWDTYKNNEQDKFRHGTRFNDRPHCTAKLTSAQVVEIRTLIRKGEMSQSDIARAFGVSPNIISRLKLGHCYKAICANADTSAYLVAKGVER